MRDRVAAYPLGPVVGCRRRLVAGPQLDRGAGHRLVQGADCLLVRAADCLLALAVDSTQGRRQVPIAVISHQDP
jgi:hypothetical protein